MTLVWLAVLAIVAGIGAGAWFWQRERNAAPRLPARVPSAVPGRPKPETASSAAARPSRAGPSAGRVESEDVEELLFWYRLFAPLFDADPGIRERAMIDLAGRPHQHPAKGKQFFDRGTLQRHYDRVARFTLEELLSKRRGARQEPTEDAAIEVEVDSLPIAPDEACSADTQVQTSSGESIEPPRRSEPLEPRPVAEEVFWFNLLAPLRDVPASERRAALVALGTRPHHHPLEGHRLFGVATLERELAWVLEADPDRLHDRWHAAAFAESGVDPVHGDAGSEPFDGLEPLEGDEVDLALERRLATVTTAGPAPRRSGVDLAPGDAGGEPFDGLEPIEGDELDLALERRLATATTADPPRPR